MMFGKLLITDFVKYKNNLLYGENRKKSIFGLVMLVALTGGVLYLLLRYIPRGQTLGPTWSFPLTQSVGVLLLIAFFFVLIWGVTTSLTSLFLSSDLHLLGSLPLSTKAVFTYKYVSTWVKNSTFPFFILTPSWWPMGSTHLLVHSITL